MFRSLFPKMHHCFCTVQSLVLLFLLPAVCIAVPGSDRSTPDKQAVLNKLSGIHVPFVENRGQVGDERVRYYARTFGGTLFVTESGEMVYSLPFRDKSKIGDRDASRRVTEGARVSTAGGVSLKETLVGGSVETIRGEGVSPSKVSYFRENDYSRWQSGLVTYNTVSLGEVYPGIELALKAYGNNVEKLFTLKPHSDPSLIRINIEGAKAVEIAANGELKITTDMGLVRFTKPMAFQEIEGRRIDVPVQYALQKGSVAYGFAVSDYDRTCDLVIDPLLASTFLGKASYEMAQAIALDASGNVYVTGFTDSSEFPTKTGAYDLSYNGIFDVFISKISSDLTQLLASTYLGGSNDDEAQAIALDASGNIYVTGLTRSSDFPTTPGAYDSSKKSRDTVNKILFDVFISKLSGDLTQLLASTYLSGSAMDPNRKGGDDYASAIALDASGNVYVAGCTRSVDFPTTAGAYNPTGSGSDEKDDGFISKLNGNLTQLLASTFLEGGDHDRIAAMKLDGSGNVYVAGTTRSVDFPTTAGAYNDKFDAFISKLDGSLGTLLASACLGGSGNDSSTAIALDTLGNIYVTGISDSSGPGDFPITSEAYDISFNGGACDAFISKLSSDLTQVSASTFLGGSGADYPFALALDSAGNVYVAGRVEYTSNFPTTARTYDESFNGMHDAFISKFNNSLNRLLASTFLGGSYFDAAHAMVLDASRNVYVTGVTSSTNFPTTAAAYKSSINGNYDVFVSKFDSTLRRLDPKGDVDRNDIVDLADAILAIQVSSGMSSTNVTLDADVNKNDRIDLAEVIYILQKIAGMR